MCVCFLDDENPLDGPTQEIRDLQAEYRRLSAAVKASVKRIAELHDYDAPQSEIDEEKAACRLLMEKRRRVMAQIIEKWSAWREANPNGEGPTQEELNCCV
jgi:hypothetical protein